METGACVKPGIPSHRSPCATLVVGSRLKHVWLLCHVHILFFGFSFTNARTQQRQAR